MTEIIDRPQILSPSMGRSVESQARYEAHAQEKLRMGDASCDLCTSARERALSFKLGHGVLELVQNHIAIVENDFPYAVYDGQEVLEHRMIVPKGHYAELDDLPPDAGMAYWKVFTTLMKEYRLGAIRSPESQGSSIKDHAHMHLYKFGRSVVELSFSKNDGISLVRFRGEDALHPL